MGKRIIVIGANAAGVEAASAARKKDHAAEITLITQEKTAGYSRCGLPFVIGGQIPSFKDLIVYSQAYFQMMKLNLKTRTQSYRHKHERQDSNSHRQDGRHRDATI